MELRSTGNTALCVCARAGNHVGVGVQRLDVLVAVLLARERMNSGGLSCLTPLALMLAALPSRPLEMVADVLASREYARVHSHTHTYTNAHTHMHTYAHAPAGTRQLNARLCRLR